MALSTPEDGIPGGHCEATGVRTILLTWEFESIHYRETYFAYEI